MDIIYKAQRITKKHLKQGVLALIVSLVLLVIGILVLVELFTGGKDYGFLFVSAFFGFVGTLTSLQVLSIYYRRNKTLSEALKGNYHLHWNYPNGNELVITKRLILKETKIKKTNANIKFEGLSWGSDNVKNAVDDIRNGGLPISLVIPRIKFSISTNKVPFIIDILSQWNTIELILIKSYQQNILHVGISEYNGKNSTSMLFPIMDDFDFIEEDFMQLVKNTHEYTNVNYSIINLDESIDSINMDEEE